MAIKSSWDLGSPRRAASTRVVVDSTAHASRSSWSNAAVLMAVMLASLMSVAWPLLVSISAKALLLATSVSGGSGTYWVLPERLVRRRTSLAPICAISSGVRSPDSRACMFWSMRRANSAGSGGSAENWMPSSTAPAPPRSFMSPKAAFSNTSSQVLYLPPLTKKLIDWSM